MRKLGVPRRQRTRHRGGSWSRDSGKRGRREGTEEREEEEEEGEGRREGGSRSRGREVDGGGDPLRSETDFSIFQWVPSRFFFLQNYIKYYNSGRLKNVKTKM